jgi:hypothetical protein
LCFIGIPEIPDVASSKLPFKGMEISRHSHIFLGEVQGLNESDMGILLGLYGEYNIYVSGWWFGT